MWKDSDKVKEKINELLVQKQPVLLAIDGYGGAGKRYKRSFLPLSW